MTTFGRRSVSLGLGAIAATALLGSAGSAIAAVPARHDLNLVNLQTGEKVAVTYRLDGRLVPAALREVDVILRDHRTDETLAIDTRLLDLLSAIQKRVGRQRIGVLSGYRSPRTNAILVSRNDNAARRSLHMQGRAVDITIRGVDPHRIAGVAKALGVGGVGLYTGSGIVHLDTGPVRYWGS